MKRTAPTAWLLQFAFGMSTEHETRGAGEVAASISRSLCAGSQDHPTCSPGLRPTPTLSADALCIGWGNRQACLSNKCRSSQHHLGIGLRLVTRAIHGRRCMQSSQMEVWVTSLEIWCQHTERKSFTRQTMTEAVLLACIAPSTCKVAPPC